MQRKGEEKDRTKQEPFTKRVTDGGRERGRDEERVLQPKVGERRSREASPRKPREEVPAKRI